MANKSKLWCGLSRATKQSWRTWAKSNRVLLASGDWRLVSAAKAFTVIMANRALAGAAANPTAVPVATTWLDGALTIEDAGPFTENAGYVGLHVAQTLAAATKWFVWATPPVTGAEVEPRPNFRFVKMLALSPVTLGDLVPDFGPDYQLVHGPWDGPGTEGAWPADHFIYFRVHHYFDGQLSPGVTLKGRIQVEL